jgi:hypothetical protein
MDNKRLREILSLLNTYTSSSKLNEGDGPHLRVASDGSRSNPSQKEEEVIELPPNFNLEFNLTVRLRQELSQKQASLLLAILNYQACHYGVNFGMYLSLEFLSSYLIGNKSSPLEIKDKFSRDCVYVSCIILSSLAGRTWSLLDGNRVHQKIIQSLIENKLVMSKRTYGSRYTTYRPELLLEVRTVPVESLYERNKGNSIRYSSYCKGYGESHPSARRLKTKPSFELDGDYEEKDFIKLDEIPTLLILTQLEIWTKYHRKTRE